MTRRTWRAQQNTHVGTRRQILESTLVAERIDLWADMQNAVDSWDEVVISNLIRRIRRASEALGYPTEWRAVPVSLLFWYERVETCYRLGIVAEVWDRDSFRALAGHIPDELRHLTDYDEPTDPEGDLG